MLEEGTFYGGPLHEKNGSRCLRTLIKSNKILLVRCLVVSPVSCNELTGGLYCRLKGFRSLDPLLGFFFGVKENTGSESSVYDSEDGIR